ncbi:hypothetical protein DYB32_006251 [Aphanomyces invadans]|uniref:EGF-like domain-containing protein n=1 Tax=Aphanomyces invadans TaxID=157072 RepID=A0A3R6WJS1_9STRA|nr:hypothetical protein DYB32_006251 [Aphanomyces invadans]
MSPCSALVCALVAAVSCTVQALDPIVVRGNYMYNSVTGDRFVMRGVPPPPRNDNYEKNSKEAIDRAVQDFNGTLNTLRIYQINPEKNYSIFMDHMEKESIYVMLAASPGTQDYFGSYQWSPIAKASPPNGNTTCYPSYLLHYGKSIAKMFAPYNHTLGLIMANEVMQASLIAAPCVKQYVADLKNWMRSKHDRMRLLPLAYAAADGAYVGDKGQTEKPKTLVDANEYATVKIQGLLCGDTMVNGQMMSSIDIYLVNEYRWCPGSKYADTYAHLQAMASGVPIVMGLGEFGCDKNPPRDFAMIPYLFGDSKTSQGFSDVYSGGFVYSFGEANLGKDTFFPLFTGGDHSITGKPGMTATPAYQNLVKQFKAYPPFKEYAHATWNADNMTERCTWVPPLTAKTSPSNKRATTQGWVVPECTAVTVVSTDVWTMDSREGAPCSDDGAACDVAVPKSTKALSQQALCGGILAAGKNCRKDSDCGVSGTCMEGLCECKGCFTGAGCKIAINDESICSMTTKPPVTSPLTKDGPSTVKPNSATIALVSVGVLAIALVL